MQVDMLCLDLKCHSKAFMYESVVPSWQHHWEVMDFLGNGMELEEVRLFVWDGMPFEGSTETVAPPLSVFASWLLYGEQCCPATCSLPQWSILAYAHKQQSQLSMNWSLWNC